MMRLAQSRGDAEKRPQINANNAAQKRKPQINADERRSEKREEVAGEERKIESATDLPRWTQIGRGLGWG
jgi:hypothetical protein